MFALRTQGDVHPLEQPSIDLQRTEVNYLYKIYICGLKWQKSLKSS